MVSDCGHKCKGSRTYSLKVERERDGIGLCKGNRTTCFLEVERARDGVRLRAQMQRKQENLLAGDGDRAQWRQMVDTDARGTGTTYSLEVERKCDSVRLWAQMQGEQDNVPTAGGEGG